MNDTSFSLLTGHVNHNHTQHNNFFLKPLHFLDGELVALLVARRTNNQPTIGRLRVPGLLSSVYHSVDR